jgi:ubiquinone/menaquinone biosynthesis C-methylase UbiE
MQKFDPALMEQIKRLNEVANGFRQSTLLLTANRLGLFTHLHDTGRTADQIAKDLRWNRHAAEVFLNALTAMGFLIKEKGVFSNAEISQTLLVKRAPFYQGDILNHNQNLMERWSRAEEVLISGKPLREPGKRREGDDLRDFINGMANLARLSAAKLWQMVDLSSARKLLDLGGGPGTYALAACQQYPKLEATVFDLSEVEPIFQEHRKAAKVGSRIRFHAGDYLTDALPSGFDVCLISNIIHSLGEEDNRALFDKAHSSLDKGGRVIVKDFFISEDGTAPLSSALFSVNMLLGTEEGGCYTPGQVEGWLAASGFRILGCENLTEQAGIVSAETS